MLCGFRGIHSKGRVLTPGNNASLNGKLKLTFSYFGSPVLASIGRERISSTADSDYQGGTGLLLYNGGNKEYVWNIGDSLGSLLVLPCSMIKIKGK